MRKKIKIIIMLLLSTFLLSGCKNDSMDNIEIVVTNYANEYITKRLYNNHATIYSIYPDGVDINSYVISKKQKKEYARKDLFVYNGLIEREKGLALELLAINPDLRIIDTAYVLETEYSPEELWLNPSSLLMMSQNVRLSLNEYSSSTYLKKDVDAAYEELKIDLSELDATYRIAFDSTNNKTIITSDSALKYLEKFGLEVYCIDDEATQKILTDAENLIKASSVNYIFMFEEQEPNENAKTFLNTYKNLQTIHLHKLDNITDEERSNKKDYMTLMIDNLDMIKKELYQ